MKCTSYYREDETITYGRYEELKENIKRQYPNYKWEELKVRKLRFTGQTGVAGEAWAEYDLCIKNGEYNQIYLEKKTAESGRYYKSCISITKEQAEKIIEHDIEWMKKEKDALLTDFYLHLSVNQLQAQFMTDYEREAVKIGKKGYAIFNKKILREASRQMDFFGEMACPIACVGTNEVHYEYKQIASIPVVLSHMLQQQEEHYEKIALCV